MGKHGKCLSFPLSWHQRRRGNSGTILFLADFTQISRGMAEQSVQIPQAQPINMDLTPPVHDVEHTEVVARAINPPQGPPQALELTAEQKLQVTMHIL